MLGFGAEAAEQLQKARDYYQKAVKFDPQLAVAQYNLGNILARLGSFDEAIEAYQMAVEANPNYEDAQVNLSILLTKQRRFAEAIKHLDEAMLLGYTPPQEYLQTIAPYRDKKVTSSQYQ